MCRSSKLDFRSQFRSEPRECHMARRPSKFDFWCSFQSEPRQRNMASRASKFVFWVFQSDSGQCLESESSEAFKVWRLVRISIKAWSKSSPNVKLWMPPMTPTQASSQPTQESSQKLCSGQGGPAHYVNWSLTILHWGVEKKSCAEGATWVKLLKLEGFLRRSFWHVLSRQSGSLTNTAKGSKPGSGFSIPTFCPQ